MGKQFDEFVISSILYPTEDIAKILYRFQIVVADICKDGHETCETDTYFRTTYKEIVVAVLRKPAYLTFTYVIRQVKAAVLKATEYAGIFRHGIVDRLEKLGLILCTEACLQLGCIA